MVALSTLPSDASIGVVRATGESAIDSIEVPVQNNEAVLFADIGVVLYQNSVVLNFQQYALRDIYGVSLREQPRDQRVVLGVVIIGSIVAIPVGFVSLISSVIFAAIIGCIALALRLAVPSTHILRVTTPAGDRDVLVSRNRKYMMRVFEALNNALAEHHALS